MDHQPFENWILDPRSQKAENAQALQQHLETCPTCRALQINWQSAEHVLRQAQPFSPHPGFTNRWETSLAQRRARQHVRQTRILLLSLGLAALASLLLLIGIFLSVASPVNLLVGGTRIITGMNSWLITVQHLITSMLSNPLPLAIWIGLGCGLCLLVTFWMVSLWRISIKGVYAK